MVRLDAVVPHFRVARPSANLEAATDFYTRGLGLELLASFKEHAGFDGVILGNPQWPYHLEFTRRESKPACGARTDEDLIVFYLSDSAVWSSALERLRAFGATEVANANPYWNQRGVTFEDPDGNLIVLQNADWP